METLSASLPTARLKIELQNMLIGNTLGQVAGGLAALNHRVGMRRTWNNRGEGVLVTDNI